VSIFAQQHSRPMPKHRSCFTVYAETRKLLRKPEDAHAETRSCYTVRGCICRNTKQLHGSRTVLKHRSCHSELQMLRHSGDRYDAETRTLIVISQGRHSQGAQFTWLKQPVNCDAETASTAMKRSRYTSCNSDALFSLCISIRLHENRIPYADLERRSELA
jgi:hypothetical protein